MILRKGIARKAIHLFVAAALSLPLAGHGAEIKFYNHVNGARFPDHYSFGTIPQFDGRFPTEFWGVEYPNNGQILVGVISDFWELPLYGVQVLAEKWGDIDNFIEIANATTQDPNQVYIGRLHSNVRTYSQEFIFPIPFDPSDFCAAHPGTTWEIHFTGIPNTLSTTTPFRKANGTVTKSRWISCH